MYNAVEKSYGTAENRTEQQIYENQRNPYFRIDDNLKYYFENEKNKESDDIGKKELKKLHPAGITPNSVVTVEYDKHYDGDGNGGNRNCQFALRVTRGLVKTEKQNRARQEKSQRGKRNIQKKRK